MANIFCPKCTKNMDEKNFYKNRDGSYTELCKKCLTMHIDSFNPDTFTWILEKMDFPYVPKEWNTLRDRAYAKNPNKVNGTSVFGKYISKMKLQQWNEYGWADGEKIRLKAEEKDKKFLESHPEIKELEERVQQQYERGEISENEYKTFMSTSAQNAAGPVGPTQSNPAILTGSAGNPYIESNFIPQEQIDVGMDLSEEDKVYLAMKWGRMYQPHEWVDLEKNYKEMMLSFDIQDADTINTLILLCKTNLKMNQAINQE